MKHIRTQLALRKTFEYILLMSISISTFFGFLLIVSVNNIDLPILLEEIPIINRIDIPTNTNPIISNEVVDFNEKDYEETIVSLKEKGLYYYPALNKRLKSSFDLMYYGILNNQTKIKFTEQLSVDELENLVYIIQFDCPELFNISLTYNYDTKGGYVTAFYPDYKLSSVEYKSRLAILEQKADKIIKEVANKTEYEAELYIHDYILKNTVYDLEAKDNDDIYGCLINGKANCKGYTSTYCYLLRKAGIESTTVIGEVNANGKVTGHSWNLIKINGQYVYTDICWNDIAESQEYKDIDYHYAFFNMSYYEMINSRNIAKQLKYLGDIPKTKESNSSYYKLNGLYANNYEEAKKIINNKLPIVLSSQEKKFVIQCNNEETYNELINNITSIMKEMINDEKISINSCKYSKIDTGYTLIIHDFS